MAHRAVDPSVSREPLPLDARNLPNVCVLCSHNCGIRVDVAGGRIAKVRADETNPITRGYICNKGFSVGRYVEHDERTRHPLRRRPDGTFEPVSWDEAIAGIAARMREIHRAHGGRAFALVGIGGQANHMDGPYGLGWLRGMGSKRWFNALAQEKTQHPLVEGWMFASSPATFFHVDQARVKYLLVMGTNPRISNRGHNANEFFKDFAEDPERRMVVVDPRETETSRAADRHLRVAPGSDVHLLLGMVAAIVQHGWHDAAFVDERTVGFDTVRDALAGVDPAEMAARCEVSPQDLLDTAREFAAADGAGVLFDLGVEQNRFSTLISYLIHLLAVITGNAGRPGGSIFMETIAPPVLDPDRVSEPERALASGIPAIRALGNAGMFSPSLFPEEVMIDHPERIRAVVVEGANPLLSFSDAARWREAFAKLDLVVVIDPAMTETARLADWVLPTPVGYENWEMAIFPKGWPEVPVQVRRPVVPGPPEALPEPEIYARLVEALGLYGEPPEALFELGRSAASDPLAAMQWLATAREKATASGENAMIFWAYRTVGPHLPAPSLAGVWAQCHLNGLMRRAGVLRALGPELADANPFELGNELFRRILAHPEGVVIARANEEDPLSEHVGHPDGKIRLAPEALMPEVGRALATPPAADEAYPFVLAAGLRTRWTANTIQRDPAWRKGRGPHCALHLSPEDAARLAVADGEAVTLETSRGSAELPAALDPKLRPGHVWVPNGFGMVHSSAAGDVAVDGTNLNELTDAADRDPFTGIPHHRYVPCRVRAAGRSEAP
jgi:anaerobic selenocysteine-containing dehydrogenase